MKLRVEGYEGERKWKDRRVICGKGNIKVQ